MGCEPWLVGRTIQGVIACRLACKICQDCKEEYTPSSDALEFLGLQHTAGKMKFFHGKGCEKCGGTGHRGRVQLHEILVMSKDLSKMVCRGEHDPDILFRQAVHDGFKPMIEDGKRLVMEGITTPEEVYRLLWR
jgi:type IV pilus assembly protein PilB